jgi:hypothetical protein
MPMILLVLGILVAGAGSSAIQFGISVNEFSLRGALISAGTTALTGGLILIALAAVVSELKRFGETLRARPTARPARSSTETPEPGVALDSAAAAPPRGSHSAPAPFPFPPRPMPEASPRNLTAVEPRQPAYSAVDLSAASRQAAKSIADAEPGLESSAKSAAAPTSNVASAAAVAILKSGVVNGMAYTLYADGAIDAELPQGTARFGSIAELRAHIENNSLPTDRGRAADERGGSRVLPSVV